MAGNVIPYDLVHASVQTQAKVIPPGDLDVPGDLTSPRIQLEAGQVELFISIEFTHRRRSGSFRFELGRSRCRRSRGGGLIRRSRG